MQPSTQTLYWVLFAIGWFILMFLLVPPKQIPELARFGFWFGFIQAIVVMGIGQHYNFFRAVGDPNLLGVPLITSVSWIPPVIIFARFFPLADKSWKIVGYVLLFAFGTSLVQYFQKLIGMWESTNWIPVYTFFLAIATHSLMTGYLLLRREKRFI
jgi:hypothetical protein